MLGFQARSRLPIHLLLHCCSASVTGSCWANAMSSSSTSAPATQPSQTKPLTLLPSSSFTVPMASGGGTCRAVAAA